MISAAVSPLPVSIYMAFDPAKRPREEESAYGNGIDTDNDSQSLPDEGMKPHFYMELLIQIYQSIDFLKNTETSEEQYKEKIIDF